MFVSGAFYPDMHTVHSWAEIALVGELGSDERASGF